MESEKNIDNFVIQCHNCNAAGRKHHTLLYVDWEKRYYMINCYKCDMTEAYNEKGERIELKDQPKTENKPVEDDDKTKIN